MLFSFLTVKEKKGGNTKAGLTIHFAPKKVRIGNNRHIRGIPSAEESNKNTHTRPCRARQSAVCISVCFGRVESRDKIETCLS